MFSFGLKNLDKTEENSISPPPKMDPFNIASQLDAYDHRTLQKHKLVTHSSTSQVKEVKKPQPKTKF